MESRVSLVLRKYFGTFVAEENQDLVDALNQGESAIYQIERAISILKEADRSTAKQASLIIKSVIAQLELFLKEIEITQEPNSAPRPNAQIPGED